MASEEELEIENNKQTLGRRKAKLEIEYERETEGRKKQKITH